MSVIENSGTVQDSNTTKEFDISQYFPEDEPEIQSFEIDPLHYMFESLNTEYIHSNGIFTAKTTEKNSKINLSFVFDGSCKLFQLIVDKEYLEEFHKIFRYDISLVNEIFKSEPFDIFFDDATLNEVTKVKVSFKFEIMKKEEILIFVLPIEKEQNNIIDLHEKRLRLLENNSKLKIKELEEKCESYEKRIVLLEEILKTPISTYCEQVFRVMNCNKKIIPVDTKKLFVSYGEAHDLIMEGHIILEKYKKHLSSLVKPNTKSMEAMNFFYGSKDRYGYNKYIICFNLAYLNYKNNFKFNNIYTCGSGKMYCEAIKTKEKFYYVNVFDYYNNSLKINDESQEYIDIKNYDGIFLCVRDSLYDSIIQIIKK